jgi:GGDEF domain-containing protein
MGEHPSDLRPPDRGPLGAAAAARLERAARAAQELCATLWEALGDELRQPRAGRVAELSERLAQICSVVGELAAGEPAPGTGPAEQREIAIHDVRPREPSAPSGGDTRTPTESDGGEVRRSGEGRGAWVEAVGASLERHVGEGLPFAVLLVEALDVQRLAQAEPAAVLTGLLQRVETALVGELRPCDTLVSESRGRWWLTASGADSGGARALAERLARTARPQAIHCGVPLGVAIGTAVCPADGADTATLAAHAEVDLYAARATGRAVAPVDDAA